MRIIITENGNLLQKVLNEEFKQKKKEEDEIKHEIIKNIINPLSRNKSIDTQFETSLNGKVKKNSQRYRSHDFSQIKSPLIKKNIRNININEKINIPKQDLDKYNNETSMNIFLPIFPETIIHNHQKMIKELENSFENKNISELNYLKGVYNINYLPVKEIVNKSSYVKLIDGIEKEENIRKNMIHARNIVYRTPDKERSKKREIEENVNKQIDLKNVDLINYLNDKSDLPEKFLSNLKHFDEDKIDKVNKLCQNVYSQKIKYNNFEKNLREKIEHRNGTQLKDNINLMLDSCLRKEKSYKKILDHYQEEKPRYDGLIIEYHREIKNNYWEKFNAKHLQRIKNKESVKDTISTVAKNERF